MSPKRSLFSSLLKGSRYFFLLILFLSFGQIFAENAPAANTETPQAAAGGAVQAESAKPADAAEAQPKAEAHAKADEHGTAKFNFREVVTHHLMDGDPVVYLEWHIGGVKKQVDTLDKVPAGHHAFGSEGNYYYWEGGIDLSLTRRVIAMWIVSAILIVLLTLAARAIAKDPLKPAGRFANFIEVIFNFVRDEIHHTNMHHEGKAFIPYLLTLFFFILGCNLFGLFPSAGETIELARGIVSGHVDSHSALVQFLPSITPTGDVSVTAALAGLTFVLIWLSGFFYQGPLYLFKIVPKGVPAPLWLIMWPLELISPLAKCFSLTIRLLANMTAGHVIILAFLGLIFQYESAWIGLGSVPMSVAIYLLEIFVAFLQTYIFVLLTSMFVGSAFHRH